MADEDFDSKKPYFAKHEGVVAFIAAEEARLAFFEENALKLAEPRTR